MKKIRIDQSNINDRMEINGEEVTSGTCKEIELDGISLTLYVEYASKGYYITITKNED